jgi:hypothetical protein
MPSMAPMSFTSVVRSVCVCVLYNTAERGKAAACEAEDGLLGPAVQAVQAVQVGQAVQAV